MTGRAIQRHVLIDVDDALVDAAIDALARAMDELDIAPGAEVSIVIAGDDYLHQLNRAYRGYDKPTDVLSFRAAGDVEAWPDVGDIELGDIVISLPYAARSAHARNAPVEDELRLLAVHGLLHLLGHDDADEAGAQAMRREEARLGVRTEDSILPDIAL